MISKLIIENLILIKKSEIHFGPRLNILTGETGSGKSVILAALRLIAGERGDLDAIGKWSDKTMIEAKMGDHLIQREISKVGKSRCWVDGDLVTLSFLKQFVGSNIEIVDQNTSQTLCSSEAQRKKLDLFATLTMEAAQFADSFHEEERLRQKLAQAEKEREDHQQNIGWAETNLALIQEVNWKEGEEEALSQEHERLSRHQEISTSLQEIATTLSESSFLKRLANQLQGCARFDSKLEPIAATLKNSALELDEVEQQLRSYLDRLEADPSRLAVIEARIGSIEPLKKRFGSTWGDVEKKRISFQEQIDSQSELGGEIAILSEQLQQIEEKNLLLAQVLSAKRKKGAVLFAEAVLRELKTLNLPHAQFRLSLETQPLSANGTDAIRYLFSANPGHEPAPLDECASGGEMSRLLFAIQSVLAEKEESGSLIFDEIDSNVGGYTASILGEKLEQLARHRQVICVTHFAQVAKFAMDHFSVSKRNASIEIHQLDQEQRKNEYLRMLGQLK